jgi:predicted ATP-dependent serine protease
VTTRTDNGTSEATDPFLGPNIEAEQAILAAMMLGIDNIRVARGLIQAKHFHRPDHARIFDAILAIADRDELADVVTVSAELQTRGVLEMVGGRARLGQIVEHVGAGENLKYHAKIVRERSVRKAARDAGRSLIESAQDVSTPIDEAIQKHRVGMRGIVEDQSAIERQAWMLQIKTLQETLETDFPVIESIIGNGILTQGSYGLFAGHSGLGKTYLTIQMMAAILAGEPFLGQPTQPCRIGLLEFEMPWQSMKARAMRYGHDLTRYGLGADLLCMPKGRWYFTERDVIERIVDWCGERCLKLLVPDPLNRIRQGDANDEQVAGELLDAIHEITERTGTTILAVSHVRKTPAGGAGGPRTSTTSLDSIKGPSRYVDDADTVFMIDEVIEGNERLTRFEWAKSRFGEKPAPVFLKRLSNGFFEQVDSPSVKMENQNDEVIEILRAAWTQGVRVAQLEAHFSVSQEKARRMLLRVHAAPRGSTRDRKYYHPDCVAELAPELPGMGDE